jgi:hypothetical protein
MLIATILGVLLIPMLYVAVEKVVGRAKHPVPAPAPAPPQTLATEHGHGGH